RLDGSVELEPAAVAHGHAREPAALLREGGGRIGAEVDADVDLVALAADGDAGRAVGAARIAALTDEHVEHAAQHGLVAEDGGALAHLDLHARLGRDLPHQGGQIDLAAAPARDG